MIRSTAALLMATALLCAPAARAAPEPNSSAAAADAVLQLLQEKGLMPTAPGLDAAGLVRQARDAASELVVSAMNFLGTPYRRGGGDHERGFDCSGFTRFVFENSVGLVLPRRAEQQARWDGLLNVRRDELRPGDLVFFNTMRRAFSHVGIYIGEGKFIHSPRVGSSVRVEDMREAYWVQRYNGARRAPEMNTAKSEQLIKALSGAAEAEKANQGETRQ